MDQKEKEQYLPEDQDIINELDSAKDFNGFSIKVREFELSKLYIKAVLRSRKQTADYDKSNKHFTLILGAFALIQILIAAFQFTVEVTSLQNKIFAVFVAAAFLGSLIWFTKKMDKILEDR